MVKPETDILPRPVAIACQERSVDDLLEKEWLLTNRFGAYASSTVLGTNTRRYHGLLVAATRPPLGRIVALSCLADQLVLSQKAAEKTFDLTTFEFEGTFSPDCRGCLVEFRNDVPITFIYRCGRAELIKEIILADDANASAVRYSLRGADRAVLRIRPFLALRDYHSVRQPGPAQEFLITQATGGVRVEDPQSGLAACVSAGWIAADGRVDPVPAGFHQDPQWWHRFRYRADLARGQDGHEDLHTPGRFEIPLWPGQRVQLTASLAGENVNFENTLRSRRGRLAQLVEAVGPADDTTLRLAMATDAFIARRPRPQGQTGATILAGFHWFADWGRDAMVSLPGLLLTTRQHPAALEVLRTFADSIDGGMVPNCFDEHGGPPLYNSVDASLWFVLAADAYVRAVGPSQPRPAEAPPRTPCPRGGGTGKRSPALPQCTPGIKPARQGPDLRTSQPDLWRDELFPAVERILTAYHDGTRFGVAAGEDGLLAAGDAHTQLTWMDVKWAGVPVTPRWGKAVEINALWHAALRVAAAGAPDAGRREIYSGWARQAAEAFAATFWNDQTGCLYDCVWGQSKDESIRPNQIIAVALPHCPLDIRRQRSVVEVVRDELLTPFGLRGLSPRDGRYRGRYGSSWESRDKAYHQGTVWPWLMGPFIEAYLRVNDFSAGARQQAREWLAAFDDHLGQAGLGFVSEIFDGDPPHRPAGCIAQAWSVAEILRAKRLVETA